MSEPLSSNDVEDVLSSIRRLVSEDLRPIARVPAAPSAALAEVNGKLILTPALRVVDRADQQAGRLHLSYPRTVEIPSFEAEPLVEDRVAPAEMQKVFASVNAATTEVEQPQDLDTEAPMFDGAMMTPEEEIAAVPAWAQIGFDTDEGEEQTAPVAADVKADWADAAEASVIARLAAEEVLPSHAVPEAQADDASDAEVMFNEEVLRALVRDILREELAGSLGERITRNIRKLVRAELARSQSAEKIG
jgi:hypothetical protein